MLSPLDIKLSRDWEIWAGGDTGTYLGGAISAIHSQTYVELVLEEIPNYHYVGDGTIEEDGTSVADWILKFATKMRYWTREEKFGVWVDANTTFKSEVGHGLRFRMNRKDLELRTEITREYVRNKRLFLAPWLTIIPYEMQEAAFPEAENKGTGRYRRIKRKDHCLDGVEHVTSRRPHPRFREQPKITRSGLEMLHEKHKKHSQIDDSDPHLGIQ